MAESICADQEEQVKVAVWCIPRSTSTIFAKCMCGVEGIVVFSELFSWAAATRGVFFNKTGKSLPDEVQGYEDIFEESVGVLQKTLQAKVSPERLW